MAVCTLNGFALDQLVIRVCTMLMFLRVDSLVLVAGFVREGGIMTELSGLDEKKKSINMGGNKLIS